MTCWSVSSFIFHDLGTPWKGHWGHLQSHFIVTTSVLQVSRVKHQMIVSYTVLVLHWRTTWQTHWIDFEIFPLSFLCEDFHSEFHNLIHGFSNMAFQFNCNGKLYAVLSARTPHLHCDHCHNASFMFQTPKIVSYTVSCFTQSFPEKQGWVPREGCHGKSLVTASFKTTRKRDGKSEPRWGQKSRTTNSGKNRMVTVQFGSVGVLVRGLRHPANASEKEKKCPKTIFICHMLLAMWGHSNSCALRLRAALMYPQKEGWAGHMSSDAKILVEGYFLVLWNRHDEARQVVQEAAPCCI